MADDLDLPSNELIKKYEAKFGPVPIGSDGEWPLITTEVLEKALKENKAIQPYKAGKNINF